MRVISVRERMALILALLPASTARCHRCSQAGIRFGRWRLKVLPLRPGDSRLADDLMSHFRALAASSGALLAIATIGATPVSAANVLNVPGPYPTIQAAIDASANGDTVLVAPGTYFENISFNGKLITVQSAQGPGV